MDIKILTLRKNIQKGGLPYEGGPNNLGRHDFTDN